MKISDSTLRKMFFIERICDENDAEIQEFFHLFVSVKSQH